MYDPLLVNIKSDEKLADAKIGDLARSQGVGDCLDSVAYVVAEKLAQAEQNPICGGKWRRMPTHLCALFTPYFPLKI